MLDEEISRFVRTYRRSIDAPKELKPHARKHLFSNISFWLINHRKPDESNFVRAFTGGSFHWCGHHEPRQCALAGRGEECMASVHISDRQRRELDAALTRAIARSHGESAGDYVARLTRNYRRMQAELETTLARHH
jgi:hypothetical protein